MSLVDRILVDSGSKTGNATSDTVTFTQITNPPYALVLILTAVGAGTSLVVRIDHSPDGSNWFTLGTFAAKTAAGTELISLTGGVLTHLRAVYTFTGGTTTATGTVNLHYGVSK